MRTPFFLAALVAVLAGVACATRASVPPSGNGSPLSPAHRPGVTATVTLALDGDPPLPGEPQDGWTGLDPQAAGSGVQGAPARHDAPSADAAAPASDPHAHHRGGAPDASAPAAPTHEHGGGHAH